MSQEGMVDAKASILASIKQAELKINGARTRIEIIEKSNFANSRKAELARERTVITQQERNIAQLRQQL